MPDTRDSRSPADAKRIFVELLDLAPAPRAAALDSACAGDAPLRAAVESLLAAHDRAGGFLIDPTVSHARVGTAPAPFERPTQIGPYQVLQEIGQGGFGTVYLAEQQHPVRRRVALKLIKLGMDTRQVIARLEAERQALAIMDHPNIARIFDAGATDTGRPYFVMELVQGVPITEYCDQHKLDLRARLELFSQVCQAVQHAHHKGLIHRDIKPSNILVSAHDGRPHAKVIDFGIAKAMHAPLTDQTLFTEFRQLIGTPEYMSPEQAEGNLDIDTRSDIYSLGVLLYELLTGTTPFDARELRSKAYGEIQRIIREVEPPRPSTRVGTLRATLSSVAATRAVEPRRLRAMLRGELDWIVMRALEKDRARRYETAGALAADLQHYLAHEPVSAGPPRTSYRLRKFARRHRAGVGAAAAILLVLVAALAVSLRLYVRESRALRRVVAAEAEALRQRDDALRARDAEVEARALSEQADHFMRGMFEAIDPAEARGKPILVRDILDQAVAKLDTVLVDQPKVQGRMRRFFGTTYLKLGLAEQARRQHELADELLRAAVGEGDPEFLANLVELGRAYQFLGRADDAAKLYRRAIDLGSIVWDADDPDALMAKSNLANVLMRQNKLDEASALYDQIIEYRLRTLGPEHEQTITTMGDIAWLRQLQGRFAESDQMLTNLLPVARTVLGEDHPKTFALMNSLAQAQADNGKPDQAERTLRQVRDGARRLYGPDHRNTLSVAGMHAKVLVFLGRHDEAERELLDSIDRLRRTLGEDHYNTLLNRLQLAQVMMAQQKLEQAQREIADVAQRLARTLGADHPEALMAANVHAQATTRLRDYAAAVRMYDDLLPRVNKVLGPRHPLTLSTAMGFATMLGQQDRWPEAEPVVANVYAEAQHAGLTRTQPQYAIAYGECLVQLGRTAQAEPILREAERVLSAMTVPKPDPALQKRLSDALARVAAVTQPATQP